MLTERRIRDALPGPKTRFLWDDQVKNLGVRITRSGSKAFVLFYRAAGRKRLATLARCNEISLRDARERAGRELAAIRDGKTDPLERRRQDREAPTVADTFDRVLGDYSAGRIERGRMTESTRRGYRQQAQRYILPVVGRRKLASITRGDVERIVDPLPATTRNRVLALVSRVFTLAEAWELRPQHSNPARGVERSVERARDRVLTGDELGRLAEALADLDVKHPPAVAAIRIAAVTGLRISEVLAFQWTDIDFERGRVTLPSTKTGPRGHDLPSAALAVLANHPRINGNPWCFTYGRAAAVTYRHARDIFARAAVAAGLSDVRLHDLRRTVMTSAAAAGVGTHVLRDLLGHKTTAMADRYIRAVGHPVREAREAVGAQIAAQMSGKAADVVPIRGRA